MVVCAAYVLLAAEAPRARAVEGWRQAAPGYTLELTRDHASHPEYKVEWWYYTGNLDARDGRRFGYQLTFFRIGVDPNPSNPSRWAVRDLFMTHLALTDIDGARYHFAERANRAGIGWAGAAVDHYRVWNEDWEAELGPSGHHVLKAMDGGFGINLDLESLKPMVAQGVRGYSQKGADPGNASHYYSLTRMKTTGTIQVDGALVEVEGLSWMDHEFGTSFLETEQVGWDWFSIQLDDGSDLMLFQLRRQDGTRDVHSSATFVAPDGRSTPVSVDGFALDPTGESWRSTASESTYPTAWRIGVPAQGLDITVKALVADQELRTQKSTGVTYWEGAIEVSGTRNGKPVRGRGYLEMTGYSGASMGSLFQ